MSWTLSCDIHATHCIQKDIVKMKIGNLEMVQNILRRDGGTLTNVKKKK